MSDGTVLRLENVWKLYRTGDVEFPALKGVDLEIRKGDFMAITGASGSGKSTMMNILGCLDRPSKGRVFLKSRDTGTLSESDLASFRGRTVGFIFQNYDLIPSMSALENVALPLEFLECDYDAAVDRAKHLLELMGLKEKLTSRPNQLSGGQQQRVSIARSLAANPEVILADEPTGALDSVTGKHVITALRRLWEEEGKTLVLITHDPGLAAYAHKSVELKDGKITKTTKR